MSVRLPFRASFLQISRLFQFVLHSRTVFVIHIPVSDKSICFLLTLGIDLQSIQMGSNMAILFAITSPVHLTLQDLRI